MPSYKYQTSKGATRWFCSFYARDYTGTNRKVKKSGFATKRDADAWERNYLTTRSGSAASMLFEQVIKNFLKDLEARKKPKTIQNTKITLKNHILPYFGSLLISSITPAAVRQWENELLGQGYSRSTLSVIFSTMTAIFDFAANMYGLPRNPARAAGKPPLPAVEKSQVLHVWTPSQFARFITSGLAPQSILFFSVLFWTGCRIGEVLALTMRDYNKENKTLRINKSLSVVPPRARKVISPPKSAAANRIISLPTHLCSMLDEWIVMTDMQDPADMFFWFVHPSNLERQFYSYAEKAGLPHIRVHDLRHSHASMLIKLGYPPIAIRQRLGHASIATTLNIYAHLFPSQTAELAAKLDNAR